MRTNAMMVAPIHVLIYKVFNKLDEHAEKCSFPTKGRISSWCSNSRRYEDNEHESDNENSLEGEKSEKSGSIWSVAAGYTFSANVLCIL